MSDDNRITEDDLFGPEEPPAERFERWMHSVERRRESQSYLGHLIHRWADHDWSDPDQFLLAFDEETAIFEMAHHLGYRLDELHAFMTHAYVQRWHAPRPR